MTFTAQTKTGDIALLTLRANVVTQEWQDMSVTQVQLTWCTCSVKCFLRKMETYLLYLHLSDSSFPQEENLKPNPINVHIFLKFSRDYEKGLIPGSRFPMPIHMMCDRQKFAFQLIPLFLCIPQEVCKANLFRSLVSSF